MKATTKTEMKRATPGAQYAHGADLPMALLSLEKLLRKWNRDAPWPLIPPASEVRQLSSYTMLMMARDIEDLAAEVRGAARRVHAAKYGERAAARYVSQLERERKARKAA